MKKLLTLIGALSMSTGLALTTVSCFNANLTVDNKDLPEIPNIEDLSEEEIHKEKQFLFDSYNTIVSSFDYNKYYDDLENNVTSNDIKIMKREPFQLSINLLYKYQFITLLTMLDKDLNIVGDVTEYNNISKQAYELFKPFYERYSDKKILSIQNVLNISQLFILIAKTNSELGDIEIIEGV